MQRFFNRSLCDPPNWFGPSNQPELALASVALSSWRQPQKVVKLQHKAYTTCPFSSSSNHTAPCSHVHPCQNWPITIILHVLLESSKPSHLLTPRTSPVESGHCCGWSFSARCPSSSSPRSRFARWLGEFVRSPFSVGALLVGSGNFPGKGWILLQQIGHPPAHLQRRATTTSMMVVRTMTTTSKGSCSEDHAGYDDTRKKNLWAHTPLSYLHQKNHRVQPFQYLKPSLPCHRHPSTGIMSASKTDICHVAQNLKTGIAAKATSRFLMLRIRNPEVCPPVHLLHRVPSCFCYGLCFSRFGRSTMPFLLHLQTIHLSI